MDAERAHQLRRIAFWTALISIAHFALGTRTHSFHGAHILLGSLYMVPIFIGALAFSVRGGLLTALVVSLLYALHILVSWWDRPMANPDQWAMVGAYLFVGISGGALVAQVNRRKWERDQIIERSAHSEEVRGLRSLAAALGARDPETLRHSERVAQLSQRVAVKMGLSPEQQDDLRLAALVHDIGKLGMPDDVLFSNGELNDTQRAKIHEHPTQAAALIRSSHLGEQIASIVESHHEHPDGSGYPKALIGDQIPLSARILRVADVFDALSQQRRYKPPADDGEVLLAMQKLAGTKIDAESFAALRSVLVSDSTGPIERARRDSTGASTNA